MSDLLTQLYESTVALHKRFGVALSTKRMMVKLSEEQAELSDAAHQAAQYGTADERLRRQAHTAEEAVDVIVCALATAASVGVTPDMIADAVERVIVKNGAKTWATHEVDSYGLIARRKGGTP